MMGIYLNLIRGMFNQFVSVTPRTCYGYKYTNIVCNANRFMGKKISNYDELPLLNKKVYDLVLLNTDGNVKLFSEYIGVSQQVLDRIFRIDNRSGKYPKISDNIKEALKKKYNFSDSWFLPEGEYESEMNNDYATYLLPQSAMGGSLTGFASEGTTLQNCERIISPIKGIDFAISVYGDSMAPEYPSGSFRQNTHPPNTGLCP